MRTTEDDLKLALELAEHAGQAILPHFRRLAAVEDKSDGSSFDPVTAADKAAEQAMRAHLANTVPGDGIYAEEFDEKVSGTGRIWVLDPIDGTKAFILGLPVWGVLIALVGPDGPWIGVMAQPFVGERFYASPSGAFLNRQGETVPLVTRKGVPLASALVATTSPHTFTPSDALNFERLRRSCRLMRYGTDCYGYALLSMGLIDVVVEAGLRAFDIAPFVPLIEAAGGSVVDRSGNPVGPTLPHSFGGDVVAVGDPALLPAVLDTLEG